MARPIFLAAPDRGLGAKALIEALLRELQIATGGALKGSDVFVPHIQAGEPGIEVDAAAYYSRCLEAIQSCRVVVAVLDGPQADESVSFWTGYAFAASRPVVGYVTDGRGKGPMVEGACRAVARDVRELQAALLSALS